MTVQRILAALLGISILIGCPSPNTELTDAELVAVAKADLAITYGGSDNAASVTQDVTLPTTVATASGVSISWSSDNTAIDAATGKVTRPSASSGDASVTLTATIEKGSESDTKTFSLKVEAAPTDAELVATAKDDLAVIYGGSDDAASVTQDITLPTTVASAPGVSISWSSDNTAIDAATGVVTRPASGAGNVIVGLTAAIKKGSESDSKTFPLMVLKEGGVPPTDTELVVTAKTDLAITYGGSDNAASVTQDMTLPTTVATAPGVSISWSSNNPAIDAGTGAVTRPSASSNDASVTLTATITKGSATDTKTFDLTVLKVVPTDIGTLGSFTIDVGDATVEANTAGSHSVTVNGNLNPGSDYTLTITSPLTITNTGAITIPNTYTSTGTHQITVTATGRGNYTGTKTATFTFTVVLSDADAVAAAKTALDITDITFASGEDKDSVKQDLTLPTSGEEATTIAWSSDNTAIDAATGTVTRPSASSSSDASVTLTATITKGAATATKTFVLSVIKEVPIDISTLGSFTISVANTTAETNTEGSHSAAVNGGLTAGNDYTLSITDPLTITNAGAITIPNTYTSTGTHQITVTATGRGNYTGTKTATFTFTVVLSDADAVATAKTALDITDITFASGEDKDSVKQDLTLPTSGDEGTAISWSSDNTAIDAATGAVTRPDASSSDASVTLTATITKGVATATKTFVLTVLKEEPIDIGTLSSFSIDVDDTTAKTNTESSHSVTVNGSLSEGTDYDLDITDPLTITNAGVITIPNTYTSTGTLQITVTATGKGNYSGTKAATFTLTVGYSDAELVAQAKTDLAITYAVNDSASAVTQDLTLPTTGTGGTTIAWSSNNTAVITHAGAVTRPSASSSDAFVTLTATITSGNVSDTKTFTLTVSKEEPIDIGTLGSFTITVANKTVETNSASTDTHSVTIGGGLATVTDYTLGITSPLVITDAGAISILPNSYTSVGTHTITVTATGRGNYTGTKTATFTLTVVLSDADAVAAAKTALTTADITFTTGEDASKVIQDITLSAAGTDGTSITWASNNAAIAVAGTVGTVTRPDASSGDATVTLTATITKGSATDTKAFVLTVLKEEPIDIGTLGSFTISVANKTAETSTEGSHSVTVNGGLSSGTDYTLSITDPLTITNAGVITIPNTYTSTGTHQITVTATGKGNYLGTKTAIFTLTVVLSDADAVAAAKAALDITYGGSDNAGSVTQDLTLPTSGDEGTAISWSSDNTAIVAATGAVSRPSASSSDAVVTLTATITKGTATDTKTFVLTVVKLKTEADMFSYVDAADGAVTLNTELSAHGITVTGGSPSNIKKVFGDVFTDPKDEQASLELALIHFQTAPRNVGGHWGIDDANNGDGIFLSYTFSTPVSVASVFLSPRNDEGGKWRERVNPVSIALYDTNGTELGRFNRAHTDPNNAWDWVTPTSNYKGYQTTLLTPIEGVHTLKVLIDENITPNSPTQFNYFNVGLEF